MLRAQSVRDDLLEASFLAAGLVARLRQLAGLPLVVVEEAVTLRLVGALAALDAASLALPLRVRGVRLALLRCRFWHCCSGFVRKRTRFVADPTRAGNGTAAAPSTRFGVAAGWALAWPRYRMAVGLVVVGLGKVGSPLLAGIRAA